MKYLLDTNTCIRYINGRAPKIREHMRLIADSDIAISTVTQGEMYAVQRRVSPRNAHGKSRTLSLFALPNCRLMKQRRIILGASRLLWNSQASP
ncbi:MAG: type II toxin-antitoxin system VapC family toxin [Chloroflexota bacterium]|nr:type II toxin-antitoxin system VapC family toxin [Chloroflexota bacterium]